jgi:hypothetical protein
MMAVVSVRRECRIDIYRPCSAGSSLRPWLTAGKTPVMYARPTILPAASTKGGF